MGNNLAALGYVSKDAARARRLWGSTLAFLLGKAVLYTAVAAPAILLGQQLDQTRSIPVIVAAQDAIGPLLIVMGLAFLGLLKLPGLSAPQRLTAWFNRQADRSGLAGAFLLGVAISLAACPTLVLLFFGLLIPLSLSSAGGLGFPALFAVGTSVPLLVLVALLAFGAESLMGAVRQRLHRRSGRWAHRAAGVMLLLAGVSQTLIFLAL